MPGTLQDVCRDMAKKVDVFLSEKHKSKRLQDVQTQLRISMGVVDEAFSRYS